MKKRFQIILTIIIVLFQSHQFLFGQTKDQLKNSENFITWITPIDNSPKIKGYLTEIGDSLIVLSHPQKNERESIHYNNVKEIKVRNSRNVSRGVLAGAVVGFTTGAIIGLAIGEEESCTIFCPGVGLQGIIGGVGLSIPGAIVGGIIGSSKMKIPLNDNARNQKEELLKYKLSY